jgi:hypothetical protein
MALTPEKGEQHPALTKAMIDEAFRVVAQASSLVMTTFDDHQQIQKSLRTLAHALASLKYEETK